MYIEFAIVIIDNYNICNYVIDTNVNPSKKLYLIFNETFHYKYCINEVIRPASGRLLPNIIRLRGSIPTSLSVTIVEEIFFIYLYIYFYMLYIR